jgi:arsenite methyltransferase
MHRVLRAGGRIGISDVVADDDLTPAERAERGSYVGCIAGALSFGEFEQGLRAAAFVDISITSMDEPIPGMHNAVIKATKDPADVSGGVSDRAVGGTASCC